MTSVGQEHDNHLAAQVDKRYGPEHHQCPNCDGETENFIHLGYGMNTVSEADACDNCIRLEPDEDKCPKCGKATDNISQDNCTIDCLKLCHGHAEPCNECVEDENE